MRLWTLVAGLGLAGCTGVTVAAAPPAAIHPEAEFPAPPGFAAALVEPGTWAFTGTGTPAQAALFYRVSCVEFFDWRCDADQEEPDGGRVLQFVRGADRLRVDVRAAGSADSLRVLVTLGRAHAPVSTETQRGQHAPNAAGRRD